MLGRISDGRRVSITAGKVRAFSAGTDIRGLELWDAMQADECDGQSPIVAPCCEVSIRADHKEGNVLVAGASYPHDPYLPIRLGRYSTILTVGGYL